MHSSQSCNDKEEDSKPNKIIAKLNLRKVKRKQFPLVPAYPFTTHKSQGQTISNSVLDSFRLSNHQHLNIQHSNISIQENIFQNEGDQFDLYPGRLNGYVASIAIYKSLFSYHKSVIIRI